MTLYVSNPVPLRTRSMIERMMSKEWPIVDSEVIVPMNVREEQDAFVINALLPGIKAEDLNIKVVKESVTIQGEFKNDNDEKISYFIHEIPNGRFNRTLTLTEVLDSSKAEANIENGVLTLRVPKAEEAQPKIVKVVAK